MIHHITYASDNMTISGGKCCESAIKYGANKTKLYRPSDIDAKFYKENKTILDSERGAGYWLWKSYVINDALSKIEYGEILCYTDAGVLFENSIKLLLDQMQGDIMVFGNRWIHKDWCKMDVLRAMGCEQYADKEQLQASCIIVRKSDESIKFIDRWLMFCQLPGFIDDSPSQLPNLSGFREHRHDQSILTNLAYSSGLHIHFWPAQYNVRHRHNYKETYPVMFQHHRKRNHEW